MARELLGTKEACEYLDVSYWTLMNKLLPEIPHIQRTPRGKIKFKKDTLDKYLKEQEEKSIEQKDSMENLDPIQKDDSIVELRKKYFRENKDALIDINELLHS